MSQVMWKQDSKNYWLFSYLLNELKIVYWKQDLEKLRPFIDIIRSKFKFESVKSWSQSGAEVNKCLSMNTRTGHSYLYILEYFLQFYYID